MGKILHFSTWLLAGLLTLPHLHAQNPGDDFTAKIVNPGFEGTASTVSGSHITGGGTAKAPEGWTLEKALGGWNDIDLRTNAASEPPYGANPPYEGRNHFNLWKSTVIELNLNQRITLPAGEYELTAAMEMTNDNYDYLTDQHIYATPTTDGITYKSSVLSVVGEGNWEVLRVVFKVKTEQTVIIGAASTGNGAGPVELMNSAGWFCLDDFRLTYLGEIDDLDIEDVLNAIQEKLTEASFYGMDNIPLGTYYALREVINAAADIDRNTPIQEALDYLADLTQAVNDAAEGLPLYETLSKLSLKCLAVPDTYPGYDAFYVSMNKGFNALSDFSATNTDFEEIIEELREAYYTIYRAYMSTATQEEGRDATWLIENPKYTVDGGDPSSLEDKSDDFWDLTWTWSQIDDEWLGTSVVSWGPTEEEQVNTYRMDGWTFTKVDVSQSVNKLPEGAYTLSFDIHALRGEPNSMKIYATSTHEEGSGFVEYLYDGSADPATPWWQTVTTNRVYVSEDGSLKIGFYCEPSNGWTGAEVFLTNWQLTYYGAEGSSDELVSRLLQEAIALRDSVEIKDMILSSERTELLSAIELGETVQDKAEAVVPLQDAIAHVKECVRLYPQAQAELMQAEDFLALGQHMAEVEDLREFEQLIQQQYIIFDADTTSRYALAGIQRDLRQGTIRFQFKLTKQATANNPVDVTLAILNPTIEAASTSVIPEGWNCAVSGSSNYSNSGQHYTGDASNRYLDSHNGNPGELKYTARQSLEVPNGTYNLKVAARTDGDGVYVFGIGKELHVEKVINHGASGGGIQTSGEHNSNGGEGYGWNWIIVEGIEVTTQTIEIGVTCDSQISEGDEWEGTWLSADDFQLFCTRGEGITSIDDISSDSENDLSSIYVENGWIKDSRNRPFSVTTLSGIRISADSQLAPGFYIVTLNGKSTKITVQ